MRYCLVVKHSWETSGHVDSCEFAHTVVQTQERTHVSTPQKKTYFLFYSPIFHLFTFSHSLFSFFLFLFLLVVFSLFSVGLAVGCEKEGYVSCGVSSKLRGGGVVLEFLDLDSSSMQLMSWERNRLQAYTISHWLVSTET